MDAIQLGKKETNGHALLDELQTTVDAIAAEATERNSVVQARLAALEAEAVALQTVQVRADAVRVAAQAPSQQPFNQDA